MFTCSREVANDLREGDAKGTRRCGRFAQRGGRYAQSSYQHCPYTNIVRLELSGKSPMDMKIPPL